MNIVRVAVALCALLVLASCGFGATSEAVQRHNHESSSQTSAPQTGVTPLDDDGLSITLSVPDSFTPTETAYPRASRAVAFDMTLTNDTEVAYRPSQMSFAATVNGNDAPQIIDSTQGYTGLVGVDEEVPPGESLRFTIAFAVPSQPATVRVAIRPSTDASNAVPVFDGTL